MDNCRLTVLTLSGEHFCPLGYAREVPFGCVDQGLLSILYFLPGQAMAPHRHLDSDEYFTAVRGEAEMIVDRVPTPLPEGHTFLRRRGMLHALRNPGPRPLIVQSFQSPLPSDAATVWERVDFWATSDRNCPRCWCGQSESGHCVNCGARLGRKRHGVVQQSA